MIPRGRGVFFTKRHLARAMPYLFVAPALICVIIFLYGPVIASVALSLTDWNLLAPDANFIGLSHYQALAGDADFRLAAWNTVLYCVVLIPAEVLLPLGIALLLHRIRFSAMATAYRGLLFLPTLVSFSVAGVAWSWLLNPVSGLFNALLTSMGLAPSRWATDPQWALLCVCAVTFWKTFGLNMLLWLAALIGIPGRLREASLLDGARPWQRFWTIELPLIAPTAFFIVVTTLFQVLDDIVGVIDVLTKGGPANGTTNLLYFLWQSGLHFFQFGEASAIAVIIIAAVLGVTALQFRFAERRVFYG